MKYLQYSLMSNKADSTANIYDRWELIDVIGPKSGFDPEIIRVPEESAIIQAPPDLHLLLLPSLAMIKSCCIWISSNDDWPDFFSWKFFRSVLFHFDKKLICYIRLDDGDVIQVITLNRLYVMKHSFSSLTGIPSSNNSSIFPFDSCFIINLL